MFLGYGGDGEPIGIERQREQVRMSGPNELRRRGGHGEPQQGDGTRRPTTRTRTIITESSDRLFSRFFHEAVVQHVSYVLIFVELVALYVYPSWGTTPRNFQFSSTGVVA